MILIVLAGVTLIVGGLAGGAAITTVMEQNAQNQDTWDKLTSDSAGDIASVSDADLQRLRDAQVTQLKTMTLFATLGTPQLPSGETAPEVAVGGITEFLHGNLEPKLVDGYSNPAVKQSTDGTQPTGGKVPRPPKVDPPPQPTTVTILYRNVNTRDPNPIHLKHHGDPFSESNALYPGSSRTETLTLPPGGYLKFDVGREGHVYQHAACGGPYRQSFQVIWGDAPGLARGTFYCL